MSSVKHLVIARPSGNVTAIVFDEDVARDDMREIGAGVQRDNPDVEQVLFVQKHGDMIHGQMAGGEFCGNAARALGYVLADGEEGSQTFTMSGLSQPVTVDVKADYAKLKIRTSLEHQQIDLGNAPVPIVHLEGISHAILLPEHPLFHLLKKYASRADRWKTVMNVLDDLNLNDRPACGLIFVDGVNSSISITPYVYVRNIETLYAETACASGSIAVTALLGKNLSIQQPSSEFLEVVLQREGNIVSAEVGGSMSAISSPEEPKAVPIGQERVAAIHGNPKPRGNPLMAG